MCSAPSFPPSLPSRLFSIFPSNTFFSQVLILNPPSLPPSLLPFLVLHRPTHDPRGGGQGAAGQAAEMDRGQVQRGECMEGREGGREGGGGITWYCIDPRMTRVVVGKEPLDTLQ